MKTRYKICILSIVILTFSCNKGDDDSDSQQQQEQTTIELLTSGKWYFESKTPGAYTACEKRGYIQFMENGNLVLNSFDDGSGTCESLGEITATYILTNNRSLTLIFEPDNQSAVIDSISEDEFKITNSNNGEKIVFDKTEG